MHDKNVWHQWNPHVHRVHSRQERRSTDKTLRHYCDRHRESNYLSINLRTKSSKIKKRGPCRNLSTHYKSGPARISNQCINRHTHRHAHTNEITAHTSWSTREQFLHISHGSSCTSVQSQALRDHQDWGPSTKSKSTAIPSKLSALGSTDHAIYPDRCCR